MTVEVRAARPDEYEEAGRVTAEAYLEFVRPEDPSGWNEYLPRIADVAGRAERTTILVAVEAGRILGSATLELAGRTEPADDPLPPEQAYIRMLGVHPGARQRGVARLLMRESMRIARDAGKTVLTLNTTHRMRGAQLMYESLGFSRGPDDVFPDGFMLLSYRKRLEPPLR